MNCLSCNKPLVPHLTGDLELDRCPDCQALFFDAGELGKALGGETELESALARAASSQAVDPGDHPLCPRCGGPMPPLPLDPSLLPADLRAGEEVRLRRCQRCAGIWLGGQTASAIASRLQRQDEGKAPTQTGSSAPKDEQGNFLSRMAGEIVALIVDLTT